MKKCWELGNLGTMVFKALILLYLIKNKKMGTVGK